MTKPETVPAGFHEGTWAGLPALRCRRCNFAALRLEDAEIHARRYPEHRDIPDAPGEATESPAPTTHDDTPEV